MIHRAKILKRFAWEKPLDIHAPLVPRPYSGIELEKTFLWQPYPNTYPEVNVASYGLQNAHSNLCEIGAAMLPVLLSGSPNDTPLPHQVIMDHSDRVKAMVELDQRLDSWKTHLPSYAQLDDNLTTTDSIPGNAIIDLQYEATCSTLLQIH